MTTPAAEITRETAERREQRLLEVAGLLAEGARVGRARSIGRVCVQMRSPIPRRYQEPELEVCDPRGSRRATVMVARRNLMVTLPGGIVHVREARQAALLAGGS
ncbi:hypothetical protein ACIBKY_46860 [Nonomuraea sp. NPDC050394]|uniref:hypothetical protein n=1 Tax=Nonomuraea sp. NPDC050394 TaxID=3364363 RepID=UPI00378F4BD7